MNVTTAVIVAALLAFASTASHARIYKWVDQDGVTQYTQYPPPQGASQEIATPAAPSANPDTARQEMQERLETFNKARDEQRRAKEESKEEQAAREKLTADCDRVRKNLEVMNRSPRLVEEQADGTRTVLTDEQRAQKVARFQQQLKDHCSDL